MILCDSREQENSHILYHFNTNAIPYLENQVVIIGDYINLKKPNVFVERKKDILELAGTVSKGHARFKKRLQFLDQTGGKLYLLIEQTSHIQIWKSKFTRMTGEQILKILESWKSKHNIEIIQCHVSETGSKIVELLS